MVKESCICAPVLYLFKSIRCSTQPHIFPPTCLINSVINGHPYKFLYLFSVVSGMGSKEAFENVQHGYRMPQPELCPPEIYDVILTCWSTNPPSRPSFDFLNTFFHDWQSPSWLGEDKTRCYCCWICRTRHGVIVVESRFPCWDIGLFPVGYFVAFDWTGSGMGNRHTSLLFLLMTSSWHLVKHGLESLDWFIGLWQLMAFSKAWTGLTGGTLAAHGM